MEKRSGYKIASLCLAFVMLFTAGVCCHDAVYAGTSVVKDDIISDVKNPENGVIKYKVTVPAGERIDYSVELTPDKRNGTVDKVTGMWINRTKKTVTKTVRVKVKFLSDEYKIKASYTERSFGTSVKHRDTATAVSALKTSAVSAKLSWDFSRLGKGNKEWKYRYKYVPCKNGYKKYLQVFDSKGRQIKNTLKQTVSLNKFTRILNEMKTR